MRQVNSLVQKVLLQVVHLMVVVLVIPMMMKIVTMGVVAHLPLVQPLRPLGQVQARDTITMIQGMMIVIALTTNNLLPVLRMAIQTPAALIVTMVRILPTMIMMIDMAGVVLVIVISLLVRIMGIMAVHIPLLVDINLPLRNVM
jgi:hypothetical protein